MTSDPSATTEGARTSFAESAQAEVPVGAAALGGARDRETSLGVWLAAGWLAIVILAAILAPVLPISDPDATDPTASLSGPSGAHLLGTDQLGRDLLARTIYGARISLLVGSLATLVAGLLGGVLGILAGYFRRFTEGVLMGFVDILLAFPALILAISLTAFLGTSVRNVIIAISVLAVPAFARVARAQTLSLTERDFVRAARALGARSSRILVFEIAPNVFPPLMALALVVVAIAIVVEGSLSFLGLGVPPGTPSWGSIISAGRADLADAPHLSLVPAVALFLTVISLNVVAERLQERAGGQRR